jgi:hypothetical protein
VKEENIKEIMTHKAILSDIERAKTLFPIVSGVIRGFKYDTTSQSITNFMNEFDKLLEELHEITGKDIPIIDSYFGGGWETDVDEEDIQDLSFKIALPEPKAIEDISQEEISEICKVVEEENFKIMASDFIEIRFHICFNDYFEKLLEINLQYLLNVCEK